MKYYTKHVCYGTSPMACVTWDTATALSVACCKMETIYSAVGVLSILAMCCEALGGAMSCCGVSRLWPAC